MAKQQRGGSRKSAAGRGREVVRRASDEQIAALETRLGYTFTNRALLERALTHRSARVDDDIDFDNERLEFLGDRVLGLAIADALMTTFPGEPEGILTRRLHRLVNEGTNVDIANELDLAAVMTQAEVPARGGKKRGVTVSVLGDMTEAVLGAVYRDGGFEAARSVILRHWAPRLDDDRHLRRDPKSSLQEWAQGRGLPKPDYADIGRTGPDHAPRFRARVTVDGSEPAEGQGTNKRAAEQDAAEAFLRREGIWAEPARPSQQSAAPITSES